MDIPHDNLSPDRHAAAGQELRRIATLVAGLPAKCRQAFLLRKVEGLSQREVAQRMGISENTVEKHVGKGLRLLMDAFADAALPPQGGATRQGQGDGHAKTSRQRRH